MNNKLIFKIGIFVASLFTVSASLAGQVTIPNTFSAGTPAVASEVNQNFTSIKSAVDDNDNRITNNTAGIATNANDIANNTSDIASNIAAINAINTGGTKVFANGVPIGLLTEANQYELTVLGTNGYFFRMHHDGSIEDAGIGYDQTGCTGNVYIITSTAYYPGAYSVYGSVFYSSHLSAMIYIPKNPTILSITINSSPDGVGGCSDYTNSVEGIPLTLNDEAITGVPNSGFVGPITIGQ